MGEMILITDPETHSEQDCDFRILLQVKAKHADLFEAAKKMGSVRSLSEHLGIHEAVVGQWIMLKRVPNFVSPKKGHKLHDPDFREEFELKLLRLTGKTLDELWPESVRKTDFLDAPKTIEVIRHVDVKAIGQIDPNKLLLPSAGDEAEYREDVGKAQDALEQILKRLALREKQVILMSFGLGEASRSHTLKEMGKTLGVTRERVRQIQLKALKKIQFYIETNASLYGALKPIFGALLPE